MVGGRLEPFQAGLLLERDADLECVRHLLDAGVVRAEGELLSVEGPAGIGKTRLLTAAREIAVDRGMRVLRARGGELERGLPFGVVRQLFHSSVHSRSSRDELLEGPARLSASALGLDHEPGSPSASSEEAEGAALHGLFWLTSNLAGAGPLLVCVDDLHWADEASIRFLVYLARRLEGLPLALLTGARIAEPDAPYDLIAQLAREQSARLRLAPLTLGATAELTRSTLGLRVEDAFVKACHEASGGNPFLLRELLSALDDAGTPADAQHAGQVESVGPEAVAVAVRQRLDRLPQETVDVAEALAILDDGASAEEISDLAQVDGLATAGAVSTLISADLLADDGVSFRHPMLRHAVLDRLSPPERRHRHASAAQALRNRGADAARVAAHLHETNRMGAAWASATLREAAAEAAPHAPNVAAAHLERALAEVTEESERAQVMLELGRLELRLQRFGAAERLKAALAGPLEPAARSEAALALARALTLSFRAPEAVEMLAERLAGQELDRETGLALEAQLIYSGLSDLRTRAAALERLESALPGIEGKTRGERQLLALGSGHRPPGETGPQQAAPMAERAERALARRDAADDDIDPMAGVEAAIILAIADRLEPAERFADRRLAEAARGGSIYGYFGAVSVKSFCLIQRGLILECEAYTRSALDVIEEHGGRPDPPMVLGKVLPLLLRGQADEAYACLTEYGLTGKLPEAGVFHPVLFNRALVRAALGDRDEALEDLCELGRRLDRHNYCRPDPPWRSEAALLLAHVDRPEALRLATEGLDVARAWGTPRATGEAERALGLIKGGRDGLEHLARSVADLERSPSRLELAVSELELGAATRRAGRPAAARPHLERAMDLAQACGATVHAERAREELRASGARPRRLALSGVAALTPSERRVAELAATGETNREIAQSVFVTVRTVETHLSHCFQKLDIASRDELATALDASAAAATVTAGTDRSEGLA